MVKKKRHLLLSVTSIALGAFLAMPQTLMADQLSIYYGGRLTNPSGVPVKGPVALQASFFHTETGGTAVGGIVVNFGTVTLTDGIFQIDISLTDEEWSQIFPSVSQKVYIQLENVTEPEVYPRQLYNIAPYALKVPVDNKSITYNNKGQLSLGSSLKIPAGSTGNYVELHANPASTDGTKYTLPVAPLANKFMTTDGAGILSWVDLPGGGTITGVTAGTGLTGGGTSATVTINVDVGTTANKIVQLDGTGKLPAVDGSALTGVVASTITSQGGLATLNAVAGGTAGTITDNSITNADVNAAAAIATSKISGPLSSITGNGLGTAAALNVGVGSNNIPQLDFLGRLPALDGSALTNLPVQTPNWAVPGTIGSTTPNTGAFTTIAAGGAVISGTGPSGIPLAVAGAASQTAPLAEFRTNTGTVLSRIGSDGSLSLKDGDTNYATIRANNTMPADITFTLPPGAAGAGQFLTSDGSGNFNWGTPSGSGNMSTTTFDTNTDGRIDIAAGGTGATTPGDARTALGLGTAAEANTGVASGNVPVLGVGGTLPAVSGANLTNLNADNISAGTLPLARGGTGATTLTGVAVGNGTSPMTAVSGTANQYLRRNAGNTAYEFGSLGSLATLNEVSGGNAGTITDGTITNDDISASAAIADSKLATISTAGKVDDTALSANVTKLGNSIDVGSSEITGTLPVGNGGTGATTLTGIPVGNGTAAMSAITGTANQYLRRNSANNAYEFGDMPAANMTGLTTDMSFSGAQDRSVTVDRRTDAGQGRKFLIEAGEPAIAETDTNGGTMSISSGTSTGSGSSFIEFLTASGGTSGTADRVPTAKMTILGNGNVGIGTMSPSNKLSVTINQSNTAAAVLENSWDNNANYSALNLKRIRSSTSQPTAGFGTGVLITAESTVEGSEDEIGQFSASWETNPNSGSNRNSYLAISNRTADVFTEKLRVTSAGNLGIGTTSPTTLLNIGSDTPTTPASGIQFGTDTSANLYRSAAGTLSTSSALSISGGFSSWDFSSISMNSSGSAPKMMTLANSANTAGSGSKIAFDGRTTGFTQFSVGSIESLATNVGDATYAGSLIFSTATGGSAPAERLRINDLGNVGIGTTNPQSGLDLQVASGIRAYQICDEAGANCKDLSSGWGSTVTGLSTTADANAITIDSSERVGFGTGTPDELVHAAKSVDGDSVALLLENSQSNAASSTNETTQMRFGFDGDNDAARIVVGKVNDYTSTPGSDSFMAFYTDRNGTATEAIRILDSGNVGIGTTSPDLGAYGANYRTMTIMGPLTTGSVSSGILELANQTPDASGSWVGSLDFSATNNTGGGTYGKNLAWIAAQTSGATANNRGGDLVFATKGNGISGGPQERMRILESGHVGIGISNPQTRLHVKSASEDALSSGMGRFETNVGTNDVGMKVGSLAGAGALGYSYMQSFHSGVANDANLVLNPLGGNVGVGTTSPAAKLNIAGASDTDILVSSTRNDNTWTAGTSTIGGLLFNSADTSGAGIGVKAAIRAVAESSSGHVYSLRFSTSELAANDQTRMIISELGNVGIGTTTPLERLHVNNSTGNTVLSVSSGTPSTTAGDSILSLGSSRTDTGVGHLVKIQSIAPGAGLADMAFLTQPSNGVYTERMRIDNAGRVGIGTNNPQSGLDLQVASGIRAYQICDEAGNNCKDLSAGWGSIGSISDSGNATAISIDSSEKVGIGTGSPDQRLTIVDGGAVATNGHVLGVHADDGNVFFSAYYNDTFSTVNPVMTHWGDNSGNYAMGTHGANSFNIYTNGWSNVRMTIDSEGAVGIGTSDPSTALHVVSPSAEVRIAGSATNQELKLAFRDNNATQIGQIIYEGTQADKYLTIDANGAAGGLRLQSSLANNTPILFYVNGGEKARLTATGSLGLGTWNPQSMLSVTGGAAIGTYAATNAAPTNGLIVSGNVGIGTTSPDKVLVVSSTDVTPIRAHRQANSNGNVVSIIHSANDSGGNVTGYAATAAVIESATDGAENGAFTIQTTTAGASLEKLRITSAGNVGIGTTAPTGLLHVAANGAPETLLEAADASSFNSPTLTFSRAKGSLSSKSIVAMGDELLAIEAKGYDSGSYRKAAGIYMSVDGTPGASDMPGRIEFATTPDGSTTPAERMRIEENGYIGIGTNAPSKVLDINSDSIRVRTAKTPASSTAACDQGEIAWDANYIYVCRATNTWMRAAISTW
jgi:hypothetical protein